MKRKSLDQSKALERAARKQAKTKYVLSLYVAGITTKSSSAIRSVTEICQQYLKDRYELKVIDIYQQPGSVRKEQVIVAPTLIKKLPLPLRRLVGDMANKEKVLIGLDLRIKDESSDTKKQVSAAAAREDG